MLELYRHFMAYVTTLTVINGRLTLKSAIYISELDFIEIIENLFSTVNDIDISFQFVTSVNPFNLKNSDKYTI